MIDESTAFRPPEETPTVLVGDREARALQLTPGTVIGERYRIVSLIGRGGMGEVYRADDLKLGQPVALKFLAQHGDAQRLYEEVRIGRQVSHPNVCRLYDIAELDSHLFITMEFVDGEDLASLLRRIGALPHTKAVQSAREIALGLAAAHEKGVVHRDLKPANVMIDGSGRARVTDFGLAIASGKATDSAGTPAYMAPEQVERGEATFKSDIYSLGLILYEIFTGKRLFETKSVGELIDVRRRTDQQSLSRELREVEPAIQRSIIRCLEYEPAARPDLQTLLAALPGGDRLQAAVDAGETPSPEMVAAADQVGDLRPSQALPLLAIAIVGAVFVVSVGHRTMLYRIVPLPKPPAALVERARDLIEKFGYADPYADSAYTFSARDGVIGAIARNDRSPQWWRKLQSLDAPAIVFDYRQSRSPLIPNSIMVPVGPDDPPFTDRGMVDVAIDPKGRLVQFRAVPPAIESAATRAPDWSKFISETGIDAASLQPVAPVRAAPVDNDMKFVWLGKRGQQPVRIEAAAYHGRPVWFTVMTPGEAAGAPPAGGTKSFLGMPSSPPFSIMLAAFLTIAAVTARRNVRRGRGDRNGAIRIAAVMFVTTLLAFLCRDAAPVRRLPEGLQFALFFAAATWLIYLALEPFVRRRWPRLLIGWTRLMSGQWHDPIVGRDLLIGTAAGSLWTFLQHLAFIAPTWFGGASLPPMHNYLSAVANPRHALFLFFLALSSAIFASLASLLVFLIYRAVFRKDFVALTAMLIAGTGFTTDWGHGGLPVAIAFAFVCEWIALFVFWRFGVLALTAAGFVAMSLLYAPLTLDPTSWYFGRSLLFLGTVAAIALFGFFTSLGGKRWLPEFAIDA